MFQLNRIFFFEVSKANVNGVVSCRTCFGISEWNETLKQVQGD